MLEDTTLMEFITPWSQIETIARLCNNYKTILDTNPDSTTILCIKDYVICEDSDTKYYYTITDNWNEKKLYISLTDINVLPEEDDENSSHVSADYINLPTPALSITSSFCNTPGSEQSATKRFIQSVNISPGEQIRSASNLQTPHSTPRQYSLASKTPNLELISRGNSPALLEYTFPIDEVINRLIAYQEACQNRYIKMLPNISVLEIIQNHIVEQLKLVQPMPFIIYYNKSQNLHNILFKPNQFMTISYNYILFPIKYKWNILPAQLTHMPLFPYISNFLYLRAITTSVK